MSKEAKIMIAIAAVVVAGGIFLIMRSGSNSIAPSKPVDSKSLLRENSHMTGSPNAKVTVVEFGDYQCPACAYINPAVKQVIATYGANPNFNFVFRNFPLAQHRNAQLAAEAAESAGEQGKFWEMHDKIYEAQNDWAESGSALDMFTGYAQALGVDVNKFKQAIEQKKFDDVIRADARDGDTLGVNSTPTFFINGEKQPSIPSFDAFKTIIDADLAK